VLIDETNLVGNEVRVRRHCGGDGADRVDSGQEARGIVEAWDRADRDDTGTQTDRDGDTCVFRPFNDRTSLGCHTHLHYSLLA
jgi:hypothetical protein